MRLRSYIPVMVALGLGLVLAIGTAVLAVGRIEHSALTQVKRILLADGQDWARVEVDGLQVRLSGTAPDEATRFRALNLAGKVVDGTRLRDEMDVTPGEAVAPPRFSVEILRNDAGLSLIGLVPAGMDRADMVERVRAMAGEATVTDLLDSADFPVPEDWAATVAYALDALEQLPRAKISVFAGRVEITASSDSRDQKRKLEAALAMAAPEGMALAIDISAPRPVIAPFTLRFLIDESGGRFDACSADTEAGRARILAAAAEAGLQGRAECTLGLGVPSPRWPDAVTAGIAALGQLGGGSVTFSNADVSLVALDSTDQALFDRVVGELETALPAVFSLQAVKPEPVQIDGTGEADEGEPEFVATLSPEGLLALRGRVVDDRQRAAVEGFARARFASAEMTPAMRLDADLPDGWAARVFAGLESLAQLSNGALVVQPEFVDIRGKTGDPQARAEVSRILSAQLGEGANFAIAVTYEEKLDPNSGLPSPQECADAINAILAARKVTFDPGSADIQAEALGTIDRIAEVMKDCSDVPMEIAGHTDSQGREVMNQRLSQRRAEAILIALQARRVLTGNLRPRGYGESNPIADNGTEAGREANRRIEFTLLENEHGGRNIVAVPLQPEAGEGDGNDGGEGGGGAGDATQPPEETAPADTSGDDAEPEAPDGPSPEMRPVVRPERTETESDSE